MNPVRGSEQEELRPVVIISGNVVNTHLPVVIICPLTTKIIGYKGNVVLEPDSGNGLTQKSEIVIFQIRFVSKQRLLRKIGEIPESRLNEIKQGLEYILRY